MPKYYDLDRKNALSSDKVIEKIKSEIKVYRGWHIGITTDPEKILNQYHARIRLKIYLIKSMRMAKLVRDHFIYVGMIIDFGKVEEDFPLVWVYLF